MVHPNNREFRPYDIAGTLDKQYVLAGYHSFVKYGQRIIVFNSISAYKIGYSNTNLYLDIDLSKNKYQFYGIFVIIPHQPTTLDTTTPTCNRT